MNCEHESCHCQSEVGIVQEGRRYCSESCAAAPESAGESCHCGHAGCSTQEEISESA